MPAIILENISFSYSSKPLLENINLQVGEGERACLIFGRSRRGSLKF